jgi:putative flippase GtrA
MFFSLPLRIVKSQQFRRFAAFGIACYVVDAGTLWALHREGVPLALATTSGFVIGLAVNYALNRNFTFGSSGHVGKQMVKYAMLVTFNYVITLALVLGLSHVGVPDLAAKTVASLACAMSNFFLYRHWIFGQEGVIPRRAV